MMKRVLSLFATLALVLLPIPAYAQSSAQPVLPGTLATSGCPSVNLTPCFLPYSGTNPIPTVASYQLLTNASATGTAVSPAGGDYLLALSGTFGGATVAINSTVNGVTTTLASYTSAPASAPCFAIGAGTTVQAVVTGGSPSGLYATLGGVGPGGCSGGSSTTVTANQGTPNAAGTASWPVQGSSASGATVSGNPIGNGCRAATATPTAVTDGQAVFYECGAEGKAITLPYAIKENAVRGSASGTDNAAHSIIASAGGSLKNYITSMQCSNTSSTTTTVTVSDSASSVFIVPAVGGTNLTFPIPLATAAATAFTFTAATGVTTMTCNAQGYVGL